MCHTPPRYVWPCGSSSDEAGPAERAGRAILRPLLRRLDLSAARRVDAFAANSLQVQDRIRRFYGRESSVIYPPLEIERFPLGTNHDGGYLLVGRLVRYKSFDSVIRAFTASGRSLTVVGTGPDEARLRSIANSSIAFKGYVPDSQLVSMYQRATALLVPAEDDWGMTVLEANSCGCPVIAANWGGSRESVVDGRTGVLYEPTIPGALGSALDRFEAMTFSPQKLREHALGFREDVFHERIAGLVSAARVAA